MRIYTENTTDYWDYANNLYDLVLFNVSTKKGYVFNGLGDSGGALSYTFNGFEMGEDMPFGEYAYALVPYSGPAEAYKFGDNILETTIYGQKITERNPVLGILKYLDDSVEEPVYRDTDKEYFYRRKNS